MKKIFKYNNLSLRKKLVISYVALVIIPIFILGFYSYSISKENLIIQTKATIENNSSVISESLENNIKRENDNIKYLSYNYNFRKKLESGIENRSELAEELNKSVEPTFWYFITSDDNIKQIDIYSPFVSLPIGSFLKPIEKDISMKKNYTTEWKYEDGKIFATRVLCDVNTLREPIGIMKLEVFKNSFIESIYTSRFLNNGVILVDSNNSIIEKRSILNKELDNRITNKILNSRIDELQDDKMCLVSTPHKLSNNWTLYYYVDKSEIDIQIKEIINKTILIMTVSLVVVSIFIGAFSKIITRRILKLKIAAEQISKGDFNIELSDTSNDEIGIVTNSVVDMASKINIMMKEMYNLGLEKRNEELKALQAMINPHFLYNCLSSIKWKAIKTDNDEIADITGLLAKFYRTSLNSGKQITTVKNEIENIYAYMELHEKLKEKSFRVEYDISNDGLDDEMPNFLLQPIFENAICHGIDYCSDDMEGIIRFEFYKEKDYLIFNIYNNGSDIDEKALNEVLNSQGRGYGLFNIKERIKMYYDETCGISFSVKDNGYVCFTVKIRDKIENI